MLFALSSYRRLQPRPWRFSPVHRRTFFNCAPVLSGHNKWSKIKQKKGVMDAQKSAVYGKANRDIVVAVRTGGSADPEKNLALAAVLKRAKEQDVPKENIANALAKAARGKDKGGDTLVYEALVHNSVGIIIECMSDNINRTLHAIRGILDSHGARFAPVRFMFERKGYVRLVAPPEAEEQLETLLEQALGAGADDFEYSESTPEGPSLQVEITCPQTLLAKITTAVSTPSNGVELAASELIYAPVDSQVADSEEIEGKLSDLVSALEANEDTLRVWTSLDS